MSRTQFFTLSVLMVVASFIGGMFAIWVLNPQEALAQASRKLIRANAIELYDDNGNLRVILSPASFNLIGKDGMGRATLMLNDNDLPSLQLNDSNGNPRVNMSVTEEVRGIDRPTLTLIGMDGKDIVKLDGRSSYDAALKFFREGTIRVLLGGNLSCPQLSLHGMDGQPLVLLDCIEWGQSRVLLSDKNGKTRALMQSGWDDGSAMELFDENGKGRAQLIVDNKGSGLALQDENGKPRVMLHDITDFGPSLMIFGNNGSGSAVLGVTDNGPEIGLIDEKGKGIWGAP